MSKINVEEFVDTPVIQKMKKRQEVKSDSSDEVKPFGPGSESQDVEVKSNRGRKRK